jgi:hypothetical protein
MTRVAGPVGPGARAWWPTGADLEAMVGLTAPIAPVDPRGDGRVADLGDDRPRPDSATVLAARLSLLFR